MKIIYLIEVEANDYTVFDGEVSKKVFERNLELMEEQCLMTRSTELITEELNISQQMKPLFAEVYRVFLRGKTRIKFIKAVI